jgi:hypothetical protein
MGCSKYPIIGKSSLYLSLYLWYFHLGKILPVLLSMYKWELERYLLPIFILVVGFV